MRRTEATGWDQGAPRLLAALRRGPATARAVVRAGTATPWRRLSAGVVGVVSLALVAGTLATGATPAQAEIGNGLLLRYKLDEASGTVAHDSSGNGRDGTVNGTANWGGDQGLGFNGSNTYIKVPNNIMAGLSSITVDFDVWTDWNVGKPYFLYGFGNTNGTSGNGYLFSTGNQFRTAITMSDVTNEQQTRPNYSHILPFSSWQHVTYTQTGNTGILYENGVEIARNSNVTIAPGAIGGGWTTANYIGKSLYSSDRYFWGRMRDFRVYNRALSESEVNAVANGTEQQFEQLGAIATYNGALAVIDDPNVGPKIIFPSDYTGDMNNLQIPPDWATEFGNTPIDWPSVTKVKSALFTAAQIDEIQAAVTAKVQPPNNPGHNELRVYYDARRDRVVAETDAPSWVTDPLVAQYPGKLVVEGYTFENPPAAKCTPEQTTAGKVDSQQPMPGGEFQDAATKQQWQQVQALADYNCALGAFNDPNVGAKIIFPSDYTGDINDLRKPPGWATEYGDIPADWPTPASGKSAMTLARVIEIQDAAKKLLLPDGGWDDGQAVAGVPDCHLTAQYDAARDRVVVATDAPSWVTDPLAAAYPNQVVIEALPPAPTADTGTTEVGTVA